MGHLRQASSHAKVTTAIALAEEVIEESGSVVVFTAYKEPAKAIAQAIPSSILFSGDTPVHERQGLVDRFQRGESPAFVSTSSAGGVGIDLFRANTVLVVDRPWTPGDVEQAEDRCHRIGQTRNVTAMWLQFDRSDYIVDELLQKKAARIELVLDGKRKTLRGIGSAQDIAKSVWEAMI
jgi:superfamily II DNA or RNA helicase